MNNRKRQIYAYQKNVKKALSSVEKRGVRSIYDIINDPIMPFNKKVSYIRHHYVYYEGNYEFFHDSQGKPTKTKKMLDNAIRDIIEGDMSPEVLNDVNKVILELRKEKEEAKAKEQETDYTSREFLRLAGYPPKYELDLAEHGSIHGLDPNSRVYMNLIEKYLDSLDPDTLRDYYHNKSYRVMKKLAIKWNRTANAIDLNANIIKKHDEGSAFLEGYKKYAKEQGWE